MNTMSIGGREVLLKESFLMQDNEEVQIETSLGGQPLTLVICFMSSGSPFKTKARIDWDASTPGTIKFTAHDWENPLGTATTEPIRLGELADGRLFGFQLAQWRVGTTNRVDFFLLVGGEYGKPDKVQTGSGRIQH